jgi:peptidyl-prolyl cis-trans isomerase B (cyclophilin B)
MRSLGLIFVFAATMFAAQPSAVAAEPVVQVNTTKGTIYIRVFTGGAPRTASNFLDLVSRGFYNGKTFHRIETWCIQGGSPGGAGVFVDPATGSPRFIPLETNRRLRHGSPGVVSMARMNDINSGSCQFFITKKPSNFLDGKYAVFGMVVGGMDAVYNMRVGDAITSASIMPQESGGGSQSQSTSSSSSGDGGGTRRSSGSGKTHSGGTPPQYQPPAEIPESGF